MLRFAQALAHERGLACPEEVKSDYSACRQFLDEHAPEKGRAREGRTGARRLKHARPARIRLLRAPATVTAESQPVQWWGLRAA